MIFNIRTAFAAAALCLAVLAAAPGARVPAFADARAMKLPVDKTPLVAVTAGGEKSFTVEIADEEREQQRGLMYRDEMADGHGMLFVLNETRQSAFWMENTPLPLDLLFIGEDGRVRAILKGKPYSRASISPGVPVRFVLELKEGVAARQGIAPGDRLRHPAIDAIAGAQ
ncbi:MAG: DUF192 domain-containing protein [Mesorhizobium sp.]|nr:DUF192 domain-containing protein [Mesorhizobium sp.]